MIDNDEANPTRPDESDTKKGMITTQPPLPVVPPSSLDDIADEKKFGIRRCSPLIHWSSVDNTL